MAMRMKTKNANITATQSTTLVKNLFRAAFSAVAYVRNYFDEDCFEIGNIGSTRYHKFKHTDNKDVNHFIDWLELGVFDAMQKEYLDIVLLEVFARHPRPSNPKSTNASSNQLARRGDLLECFSFTVTYGKDGAQLQLNGATSCPTGSKDEIKKNTSRVLRSLIELTHSLRPLPKNRILSLKLLYKPHTPAEYEPPLFSKAPEEDSCWFEERPLRASAGAVSTPFHQLSMSIRAKSTTENKSAKVLAKRADPEGTEEPEESVIVDVGGRSQGNSVRARAGRPPLRESQDVGLVSHETPATEKAGTGSQPLRIRIRPPAGSQATAVDSARVGKKRAAGVAEASAKTGWTRNRKRKTSQGKDPVHLGDRTSRG